MNVAIYVNHEKDKEFHNTKKLLEFLKQKDVKVYFDVDFKPWFGDDNAYYSNETFDDKIDCIISVGGDGTFLHAASLAVQNDVPILGVNLGRLGFMTDVEVNEYCLIDDFICGRYKCEQRSVLDVRVLRNDKEILSSMAINEAVLHMGNLSRILDIAVNEDGKTVNNYRADGIIVATPTGSTGYSLSCGGPIIEPSFECLMLVPICAHSLTARPIVMGKDKVLSLSLSAMKGKNAYLSLDGNQGITIYEDDEIVVRTSPKKLSVIKIGDRSFYNILSEKLKF